MITRARLLAVLPPQVKYNLWENARKDVCYALTPTIHLRFRHLGGRSSEGGFWIREGSSFWMYLDTPDGVLADREDIRHLFKVKRICCPWIIRPEHQNYNLGVGETTWWVTRDPQGWEVYDPNGNQFRPFVALSDAIQYVENEVVQLGYEVPWSMQNWQWAEIRKWTLNEFFRL